MPRLIDADRLKEEIVEAGQESTRYRIGEFWELNRNEIWKVIDEQPTVEERKKGRWLRYGEDGYPNNEDTVFWQCDQCLEQYTGRTKRIPNFCPHCGADMREET